MIHSLQTVAKTHRFDADDFIAFHSKLGNRLTWEENGIRYTNTWFCDEAVETYEQYKMIPLL